MDGPQFKTHNAWLVVLKTDILQKMGQTASLSHTTAGQPTGEQLGDV